MDLSVTRSEKQGLPGQFLSRSLFLDTCAYKKLTWKTGPKKGKKKAIRQPKNRKRVPENKKRKGNGKGEKTRRDSGGDGKGKNSVSPFFQAVPVFPFFPK